MERCVEPGFVDRNGPVHVYRHSLFVRTDRNGSLLVSMQLVDTGFPMPGRVAPVVLVDPQNEFGLPLADEQDFPSVVLVDGQDPRKGIGRIVPRSHFHEDGERLGKIDAFCRGKDKPLDERDPVSVETEPVIFDDPLHVVLRVEVKWP